jgi:uncharacterized membrane-anchored protein YjiN (DUF445 family)
MVEFKEDPEKLARLNQMRRIATGMLVVSALTFIAMRYLEPRYPWASFIRATAEAALIGGIADWFAVTALFRYPLGLKIPHTAIVKTRKDRIGRSLGLFVEQNFLSPQVLSAKLASIDVAERLAEWLERPESASKLVRHVSEGVSVMIRSLDDEHMAELIDRQLAKRAREVEVAPLAADLLSHFMAANRRQELLEGTLRLVIKLLEENREELRHRVRVEIPWWVPAPVDEKIFLKIYAAIEKSVQEVRSDPEHPFRNRFDDFVDASIARLKYSPEVIAKGEEIKEDLLPEISLLSRRVWADLKAAILRTDSDPATSHLVGAIQSFGTSMRTDSNLLTIVNEWIERTVIRVAMEYRHEASLLIENTVAQWDADDTSRKIELQIGRDLQFIRINGTLVGGLIGLILYTISVIS